MTESGMKWVIIVAFVGAVILGTFYMIYGLIADEFDRNRVDKKDEKNSDD